MTSNALNVLRKIVRLRLDGEFEHCLSAARAALDDVEQESVPVEVRDLQRVLQEYSLGQLKAVEVARWAEFVEAAEWASYEPGREPEIAHVLFQLSTPEINGKLGPERATELLKIL